MSMYYYYYYYHTKIGRAETMFFLNAQINTTPLVWFHRRREDGAHSFGRSRDGHLTRMGSIVFSKLYFCSLPKERNENMNAVTVPAWFISIHFSSPLLLFGSPLAQSR